MKFKKMMLGLNLAILPVASITTTISCAEYDDKKPTELAIVAKTIADLQTAITKKASDIKLALNGETSKMDLLKVKKVLKNKLGDKFNALIDSLTLKKGGVLDGSVIVVYGGGSTKIMLATSTTTLIVKNIVDLQTAITNKAADIKTALSGKTSEITINKVRSVLKEKLDNSFDALIEGLTLKSKKAAEVIVKSGETEIKIATLTTTPKTIEQLKNAQWQNTKIKNALSGETKNMDIEKIKKALKDNLDPSFYSLIEKLVLAENGITDGQVLVLLGENQMKIITSTITPKTAKDLKAFLKLRNRIIVFKIKKLVKSNKATIVNIKSILKAFTIEPLLLALIDKLTLVKGGSIKEGQIIVALGEAKFTLYTPKQKTTL